VPPVNRSTGWLFHCAPFRRLKLSETGFPPRPESGGFCYQLRFSFVRGWAIAKPPHSCRPDSSLSLSQKASPFRLLAHLLRLRCSVSLLPLCASEPPQMGERSTPGLSILRDKISRPRAPVVMFSNPFCQRSQPLALTSLLFEPRAGRGAL